MKKDIIQTIKILIAALVISFGMSYAFAWAPPTKAPLQGNTSTPINTGNSDQTKSGWLGIGSQASPNVALDVLGNIGAGGAVFANDVTAGTFTLGNSTISKWPSGGSVTWGGLTGIPSGFSDNVDNIGTLDVITVTAIVSGRNTITATANCPTSYVVVGGGGGNTPCARCSGIINITQSYPTGNGWVVVAKANSRTSSRLTTYAKCARIK